MLLEPLLEPVPVKRQVLIRLPDPLRIQARELAALRGQQLGPLLVEILKKVVPVALQEERARGDGSADPPPPLPRDEAAAAGAG